MLAAEFRGTIIFYGSFQNYWASLIAQLVKNLSATQETPVGFLDQENSLDQG